MENLYKKKEMIIRIEKARFILGNELKNGFITRQDILKCINFDNNKRLRNERDYKQKVLNDIANSPFILCDQEYLDIGIKKLLPTILKERFDTEVEQLYEQLDLGYITEEELLETKEMLKFCYYRTSEEGKNILKRGKVKNMVRSK